MCPTTVSAVSSTRDVCVIKGCRRKPYFTETKQGTSAGEEGNSAPTIAAGKPTHCRGHRPDGCPSPQRLSSAKKKQRRTRVQQALTLSAAFEGTQGVPTQLSSSSSSSKLSISVDRMCQVEGCGKRASHGVDRNQRPTHCVAHRDPATMVTDHRHRLCEREMYPPCVRQASFGWPLSAAPSTVATPNAATREAQPATDKTIKKNVFPSRATSKANLMYCASHKEPGMVDLRNKRGCIREGCGKRATHAFDGEKPTMCATHREVGMMDVVTKNCEVEGCIVTPRFGDPRQKPRFCGPHRLEGMVNLKDRRCEYQPCSLHPSFALPGERSARFCAMHMEEGMVNVRNKQRCMYQQGIVGMEKPGGCGRHPTYALRGAKVPVFCLEHAEPGMVNLKRTKEAKRRFIPAPASAFTSQNLKAFTFFTSPNFAAPMAGRKRPPPPSLAQTSIVSGISMSHTHSGESGARVSAEAGASLAVPPWLAAGSSEELGGTLSNFAVMSPVSGGLVPENRVLSDSLGNGMISTTVETGGGGGSNPGLAAVNFAGLVGVENGDGGGNVISPFGKSVLPTSGPARNDKNRSRMPFWKSSFALLPLSVPRGSSAVEREVEAAIAAAVAGEVHDRDIAEEEATMADGFIRRPQEMGDGDGLGEQAREPSSPR